MTFQRVYPLFILLYVGACAPAQEASVAPVTARQPQVGGSNLLQEAGSLLSSKSYVEAAAKAKSAAGLEPDNVGLIQRAAEIVYRSGFSKESLPLFDRVVELAPEAAPQNWQRGIALCNCAEWERGALQFKTHHDVNPDDVENSAWFFLCVAKTKGLEAARKTVIPSRGDGRQPMMSVLKMLQGKLEPDAVIEAAKSNTTPGTYGSQQAQFYADLYVGLYYDCLDDAQLAEKYLRRSLTYGVEGYMVDVARVYLADRFAAPRNEDSQPKETRSKEPN